MRFSRSIHLPICSSLKTCKFHYKDWLAFSGGTGRPGDLCYSFSISNGLTQMVNFPTRIPDCDSHRYGLLDFFLLTLVLVLQWLSLYWKVMIMLIIDKFAIIHRAGIKTISTM